MILTLTLRCLSLPVVHGMNAHSWHFTACLSSLSVHASHTVPCAVGLTQLIGVPWLFPAVVTLGHTVSCDFELPLLCALPGNPCQPFRAQVGSLLPRSHLLLFSCSGREPGSGVSLCSLHLYLWVLRRSLRQPGAPEWPTFPTSGSSGLCQRRVPARW